MKQKLPAQFFIDQDSSCHWYLIPLEHRESWEEWSNLDEDDEASWEVPHYAKALGGHPSTVVFEKPVMV